MLGLSWGKYYLTLCYLQFGLCSGPTLLCVASPCLPGKALLVLGRSFLSRPSIYTQPGFGAGCQASIHFTYEALCTSRMGGNRGEETGFWTLELCWSWSLEHLWSWSVLNSAAAGCLSTCATLLEMKFWAVSWACWYFRWTFLYRWLILI